MERGHTVPEHEQYNSGGNWQGNHVSGSARVHQGHVFNVFHSEGQDEKDALMKILFSEYEKGKNRTPKRNPRTCEWVLGHEKFIRWRDNPSTAALWISADPGAGKSVLSRSLVDERLVCSESPEAPTPEMICYFFFKDDDSSQNSAEAALCAILHQLFLAKPSAIEHALPGYQKKKDALRGSLSDLWAILEAVAQDPATGTVICILDALDECDERSRNELVEKVTAYISEETERPSPLKFLMTSRPYPEIDYIFRSNLDDLDRINLRGDENSYGTINAEINLVIEQRVPELFRGFRYKPSTDVQLRLMKELKAKKNRTYLWLSLVLDNLSRTRIAREKDLIQFINQLPRNLDSAYEKLLCNILPQHEMEARRLFHILLVAQGPLRLDEMDIALAVGNGQLANKRSTSDLKLMGSDVLAEHIKALSYSFVNVVDDSIYFLHLTARQFLLAQEAPPIPSCPAPKWKSSFDPLESHSLLSRICMIYLLVDELNEWRDDYGSKSPDPYSDHPSQLSTFKFLGYATQYWHWHYRLSNYRDDTLWKFAERLCQWEPTIRGESMIDFGPGWDLDRYGLKMTNGGLKRDDSNPLIPVHAPETAVPIILAAKHGLLPLVKSILYRDPTAVSDWVLLEIIKEMIDWHGAWAVEIATFLVGRLTEEDRKAILEYACKYEIDDFPIIRFLVANGLAQPDSACLLAALKPDFDFISDVKLNRSSRLKYLLNNGANPNQQSNSGDLPLTFVLKRGRANDVRVLLEFGADPNKKNSLGQEPLAIAIWWGPEMVKPLLEFGVNPNNKLKGGRTPLATALLVQYDATETLQILLEFGANPNQTSNGELPLNMAMRFIGGDIDSFRLLLHSGADPNQTNDSGHLPLTVAINRCVFEPIRLLIAAGANSELLDKPRQLLVSFLLATDSRDWEAAGRVLKEWFIQIPWGNPQEIYNLRYFIAWVGIVSRLEEHWEKWKYYDEIIDGPSLSRAWLVRDGPV